MSFLSLPLCTALMSLAPSGETPAVQRPQVSQPEVGEPAIAPAQVETEAALAPAVEPTPGGELQPAVEPAPGGELQPAVEPAPGGELQPAVEPAPGGELQPAVEPAPGGELGPAQEPELPSWDSEPAPPVEGGDLPRVDEWGVPIATVDRSPPKGGGWFGGAAGLFGAMITKQLIMGLTCDDVYCGYRGNFDRVMGFGVVGLAAGGGWYDGRRRAFFELKNETEQGSLIKRRATGWTLFGLGMVGMLTDMVLYHVCYDGAAGPYRQLEGFSYTCSPVASVVTLDFSTIFAAAGIGLGMSAESQLRHRERNKFDLSVAPWGGRGQAGISFSGQF